MAKGIEIEVHCAEDWEALYVNGKCEVQTHSGTLEDYIARHNYGQGPLTIASVKYVCHDGDAVDRHVNKNGHFPDHVSALIQIEIDAIEAEVRTAEEALQAAVKTKEATLKEKRDALAALKAKS